MTSPFSVKCTRWVCRGLILLILVLCLIMYDILQWSLWMNFLPWQIKAIVLGGFYCCVPGILYALYRMDRLLGNILSGQVFITENVRHIRHIRGCCAFVGLVCLGAGFAYLPLLFLAAIMGFLTLAVSVVKQVMAAAVEIREENDLTV